MFLWMGVALFVVGVVGFWMARPRDGKVVSFLKNGNIQAYYVVVLLVAVFVGLLNIVLGVIPLLS